MSSSARAEVWEVHPVTGKPLDNADRHRIWRVLIRQAAARFARRVAAPGALRAHRTARFQRTCAACQDGRSIAP